MEVKSIFDESKTRHVIEGIELDSISNTRTLINGPAAFFFTQEAVTEIMNNEKLQAWFDPITKKKDLAPGCVGTLMGCQVYTDGIKEDQKWLDKNYVVSIEAPAEEETPNVEA